MNIVFFYSPMSSATPVVWALAELGVPHDAVKVDLGKLDQRKPEFLRLNPNGKVPTLVADGTPMFEGLAIMIWLADQFGVEKKLWPSLKDPARMQALAWSTWGYVSYGPLATRHGLATSPRSPEELRSPAAAAHAKKEIDGLLAVLDARLAEQPYVLGDAFSMADVIDASVVRYSTFCGVDPAPYANVKAWLGRCESRPAFRELAKG